MNNDDLAFLFVFGLLGGVMGAIIANKKGWYRFLGFFAGAVGGPVLVWSLLLLRFVGIVKMTCRFAILNILVQ